MDEQTLKALKGSITEWRKVIDGTGGDEGTRNCPLCDAFYKNRCKGCPVKKKTRLDACRGSPYDKWIEHHSKEHIPSFPLKIECKKCKEIAIKELKFLKSLLKECDLKHMKTLKNTRW